MRALWKRWISLASIGAFCTSMMAGVHAGADGEEFLISGFGYVPDGIQDSASEIGDLDYDGTLTSADSNLLLNCILSPKSYADLQTSLGDYNSDGVTNVEDAVALANALPEAESAAFTQYVTDLYNQTQNQPHTFTLENSNEYSDDAKAIIAEAYHALTKEE